MMSPHLLSDGFTLMAYGMGFVFAFLTILVVAIGLMSRCIDRFCPQSLPPTACPIRPPARAAPEDDTVLLAVLTAAVHRYRSTR